MSGTPQHKGHPTRTEARTPLRTRVKVRCDSWDRVLTLYTQNISRGGMFVRLENPPPVEPPGQVQHSRPDGRGLGLTARVAPVVTPERARADGKNAGAGPS